MSRTFGITGLVAAAMIIAGGKAASIFGLVINTTPSLPLGLWQTQSKVGHIADGQAVTFCPPDSGGFALGHDRGYIAAGACPDGLELMLKPVAAVAGDIVVVDRRGIAVNGRLIQNSKPLSHDSAGRPLASVAPGQYTVQPGTIWLVSAYNAHSYDSRYFGSVSMNIVNGDAKPLLIFIQKRPD